jgi:CRP-like cAMP-binding protein
MYEDLLASVPLFRDLSWRERVWLGDACRERIYTLGDHIQRQNSTSAIGLFIVMAGSVRLNRNDDSATEFEPGQLGVGAILGEQALLEDTPAIATITANEPTRLLVLPIWDFRMTLRDFPDLAIHLIAILGQRLRQMESRVE